jgi:hypothetical protein
MICNHISWRKTDMSVTSLRLNGLALLKLNSWCPRARGGGRAPQQPPPYGVRTPGRTLPIQPMCCPPSHPAVPVGPLTASAKPAAATRPTPSAWPTPSSRTRWHPEQPSHEPPEQQKQHHERPNSCHWGECCVEHARAEPGGNWSFPTLSAPWIRPLVRTNLGQVG